MVDRHAAVPLYHQIFLQFRDEILSGERPFGSLLPTEKVISSTFNVSRITTRRVLAELSLHNLVARKRRSETRVIFDAPIQTIEANMDQAVEALIALGKGTSVKVVEFGLVTPGAAVLEMLQLCPDEEVLRAVRVRHFNDQPLGHIVNYLPAALADHVQLDGLTQTPLLQLLADAGYRATHAKQSIGACLADPNFAEKLGIDSQSALIRISRTAYDRTGRPFLLTFAHYRADKFVIGIDFEVTGTCSAQQI